MITDLNKALELVNKDWGEYFNLSDDLRWNRQILNIVMRADDLFADGPRAFHHSLWRDDQKFQEFSWLEYDDVTMLVEEACDNYTDNLNFPDSNIPPYLMSEDDVFYRYNLNVEIADLDDFEEEDADDIRERVEQVVDDRILAGCREYFKGERESSYISLNPTKSNIEKDPNDENHKQIKVACLIHIDNLYLAPPSFFTEKNLCEIFEEHHKALSGTPIQMCWQSDMEKLLSHINSFLPFKDLGNDSPLIKMIAKNEKYSNYLSKFTLPQMKKTSQFDPKAEKWAQKNPWFGKDLAKTYSAFKIHDDLVNLEGFDTNSDEYYTELDQRIKAKSQQSQSELSPLKEALFTETVRGNLPQGPRDAINELILRSLPDEELIKLFKKEPHLASANFDKLPLERRNNRVIALAAVSWHGHHLEQCNEEFRADKEFVLAAVKYNGSCIQYASADLQNNREFLKECLKLSGYAMCFVSNQDFLNDKELILLAIDNYDSPHEIIKKASNHIKSDPEVILAGVKKQAGCLSHASESLHHDQKFIFECLKIDGCCLSSIKNQEFLNDRDIVTTALNNLCDDAIQWDSHANGIADKISDELKKDRNIADKILNANPCTISYFPHFDYTKEEILGFVRKNSNTYYQLDESYKKDPDVISCAIEKNASIYERLSEENQLNKDFALKAIKLNSLLYVSLPSELKEDEEIINFILDNPIKR